MSQHPPGPESAMSPPSWTPATPPGRPGQPNADPALQRDLRRLSGRVQGLLAGLSVLEVACGDGWWTACIAQAAQSVVALEVDAEALHRAQARRVPVGKVRFLRGSSEALNRVPGLFDAGFAAFLSESMRGADRAVALSRLHARLGPGAVVVLVDQRETAWRDAAAEEAELRAAVRASAPDARGLRLSVGEHLWCLSYTL